MTDAENILRLRLIERLSLRAIGQRVGLSGERVRKILLAHNVDSGRTKKRGQVKDAERDATRRRLDEKSIRAIYGCDIPTLRSIQGRKALSDPSTPAHVYRSQRKHYQKKGKWAFTFPDWWSVWQVRWPSRKSDSLILVPKDPTRPMGLGNAEIITRAENMRRYWKRKRS